jgi:uncharacterized protein (TIGR02996 family)
MDDERALLLALSERPLDGSLRAVFADWLLERGDPRGEVIALCAREKLSLTEQRRVARITHEHGPTWLGPFGPVTDFHRTRFENGFVTELALMARAGPVMGSLVGEPVLATVQRLMLSPGHQSAELVAFLTHPVLSQLARLEMESGSWGQLAGIPQKTFALADVVVSSWGTFENELAPLAEVEVWRSANTLGLSTTEFVNPLVVQDIVDSLRVQSSAIGGFGAVQLVARYGVIEGCASWLLAVESMAKLLPAVAEWSVDSGGVSLTRSRGEGAAFDRLSINLSAPEGQGEKQASAVKSTTEIRIATAASVLVLLGGARLTSVTVTLAPGARLRPQERSTLVAAARRSGMLERFAVVGE